MEKEIELNMGTQPIKMRYMIIGGQMIDLEKPCEGEDCVTMDWKADGTLEIS